MTLDPRQLIQEARDCSYDESTSPEAGQTLDALADALDAALEEVDYWHQARQAENRLWRREYDDRRKAEAERDAAREETEWLREALRRVLMWISDAALAEDDDTALTEARRVIRAAALAAASVLAAGEGTSETEEEP